MKFNFLPRLVGIITIVAYTEGIKILLLWYHGFFGENS